MGTLGLSSSFLISPELKPSSITPHRRNPIKLRFRTGPVARLFGPAIFEASKLKVLFLGVDEKKHPGKLPRTYTLTHSDVLKAFVHGDGNLLNNYPELQESLVWVYFHSNIPEYNKVECWGPLKDAAAPSSSSSPSSSMNGSHKGEMESSIPEAPCQDDCSCCFPPMSAVPVWSSKNDDDDTGVGHPQASGTPQNL